MKISSLLVMSILVFSSITHAGKTFDDEKPAATARESKTFRAIYQRFGLAAWTGDENEELSKKELNALAASRANQICQYFGYEEGTYDSVMVNGPSHAFLIENGQLTRGPIHQTMDGSLSYLGHLATFGLGLDSGRVFKNITCFR